MYAAASCVHDLRFTHAFAASYSYTSHPHCPYGRQFGIFDHYEQWTNKSAHNADVTSKEHSEVARSLSRSATVLLKNENSLLPIDVSKKPTIAVGARFILHLNIQP